MNDYPEGPMLDQTSQMMQIISECHLLTEQLSRRLSPITRGMNQTSSSPASVPQQSATEMEDGLLSLMGKLQALNERIHI